MYVQNGIVYAGEPKSIIKVLSARPLDDYKLWIRFTNGDIKEFDFTPLLDEPAFKPLKDKAVFNSVYVDFGCTVWNNGDIDIAPEYLFEKGIIVPKNNL